MIAQTAIPQKSPIIGHRGYQNLSLASGFAKRQAGVSRIGTKDVAIQSEMVRRLIRAFRSFRNDFVHCKTAFSEIEFLEAEKFGLEFIRLAISSGFSKVSAQPTYEGSVFMTCAIRRYIINASFIFLNEPNEENEVVLSIWEGESMIRTFQVTPATFLEMISNEGIPD